jgi:hypothetical protein
MIFYTSHDPPMSRIAYASWFRAPSFKRKISLRKRPCGCNQILLLPFSTNRFTSSSLTHSHLRLRWLMHDPQHQLTPKLSPQLPISSSLSLLTVLKYLQQSYPIQFHMPHLIILLRVVFMLSIYILHSFSS